MLLDSLNSRLSLRMILVVNVFLCGVFSIFLVIFLNQIENLRQQKLHSQSIRQNLFSFQISSGEYFACFVRVFFSGENTLSAYTKQASIDAIDKSISQQENDDDNTSNHQYKHLYSLSAMYRAIAQFARSRINAKCFQMTQKFYGVIKSN